MPVSNRVRAIIAREMPGWRIVEDHELPRRPTVRPDATSPSIAAMQRKYFGHITTLEVFKMEFPHLSDSQARARFKEQLGTRGAVLNESGKIIGMRG
jgi:hypothetical protein